MSGVRGVFILVAIILVHGTAADCQPKGKAKGKVDSGTGGQVKADAEAAIRASATPRGIGGYVRATAPLRLPGWRAAAEKKIPEGQFLMGLAHRYGAGVTKNFDAEADLFRKSADQGYPAALYLLGLNHQTGHGVAPDADAALKCFRAAASKGFAPAMEEVAYCYRQGTGAKKDAVEAAKWFLKAAEAGSASARNQYAWCRLEGNGAAKSASEAVKHFKTAAEAGDAAAARKLGLMYFDGDTVARDKKEAMRLLAQSAARGDAFARFLFGTECLEGKNTKRDDTRGALLLRRAADSGLDGAQSLLAGQYAGRESAMFDRQDITEAVYLYRQAAAQGHEKAVRELRRIARTPFERSVPKPGNPPREVIAGAAGAAFQEVAGLMSWPVLDVKTGRPLNHSLEGLYFPGREGKMHQDREYSAAVASAVQNLTRIGRSDDRKVQETAAAARRLVLLRSRLNILNEQLGNTMYASLGSQQSRFWGEILPGLLGTERDRFERSVDATKNLFKDTKDRSRISGAAKFADFEAADAAADFWGRYLVPWAATVAGPVVTDSDKVSVAVDVAWESVAEAGSRFDVFRHVTVSNNGRAALTRLVVKARLMNEWNEFATGYYFIPALKPRQAVVLVPNFRFRDRFAASCKEVTTQVEVWANEGTLNRSVQTYANKNVMTNYLHVHNKYRTLEVPFLKDGRQLYELLSK